jgi:hypothetical protein
MWPSVRSSVSLHLSPIGRSDLTDWFLRRRFASWDHQGAFLLAAPPKGVSTLAIGLFVIGWMGYDFRHNLGVTDRFTLASLE